MWEFEKIRVGFWTPNEKDQFWSSQARGKFAPYGGPLELGAKWIRQHRRLCLSFLRRNLELKIKKRISTWTRSSYVFLRFLFFIYSIVMNITCLFCTWPYSCIWLHNINMYCSNNDSKFGENFFDKEISPCPIDKNRIHSNFRSKTLSARIHFNQKFIIIQNYRL